MTYTTSCFTNQKINNSTKIKLAQEVIQQADFVIIGAGAGLSAAAGLTYSGKRFTDNFGPFIEKYHMEDMYTSSFYPFRTEEECWAYWAKHISVNRYETPATALYKNLLSLVSQKEYFVITTNVESQFLKSGFDNNKIFAVQGDYSFLQCINGCHDKLYYNEELIRKMIQQTVDCKIPTELVPKCPVCGAKMDVNLRKDNSFVEDENWTAANKRYNDFVEKATKQKLVLLELGVGFNTPGIIRYPFEQLTYKFDDITLIRINVEHAFGPTENEMKTIILHDDINNAVNQLLTT